MEYRQLGKSDIKVSAICLGTMTWGQQNTQEEGHAQMDYALEQGINFFDTAEMYPIPPKEETQGRTESIIGEWFQARKNRDKIILATKVSGRGVSTWLREDGSKTRLIRAQMEEALEKSLKRLQTDYVDLYQLHWPDRPLAALFGGGASYQHIPSQSTTPIDEILRVLQDMVKAGKVRTIGLSNETSWGIMKFLHYAETKNLPRVVSVQNAYNLLNRCYEQGSAEIFHEEGTGLLAYSPLAQGYLTGKYQKGALPEGSRKQLFQRLQRYEKAGVEEAIDAYLALAKKYNITPTQLAVKFVTTRSFVTSNIIGATTMEQLKEVMSSEDIDFTDELLADIDAIHTRAPNLCP